MQKEFYIIHHLKANSRILATSFRVPLQRIKDERIGSKKAERRLVLTKTSPRFGENEGSFGS